MNQKTSEQPAKKSGLVSRINLFVSRLSLPTKAAAILSFFLIMLVIFVGLAFWLDPNNVPWRHSMTYSRMLVILGLVVLLPVLLYQLVRIWLLGDRQRFPDIDFAWRTGLSELEKQGITLDSAPVFLILGSSRENLESALMEAAERQLQCRGIPEGPTALHWYAHHGAIYLFLTNACRLSAMEGLLQKREASELQGSAAATQSPDDLLLSSQASLEYSRRLNYVCELLRQARQPASPCNGILTLLSISAIGSGDTNISELERSIKADLMMAQRSLQVRCPVVALVVGMERETGFRELVRRVATEHPGVRTRRFGKGFDLNVPGTSDELSLFAAHVVSSFEDWTHLLFRDPGALTRPGNRHLYALLCRVRTKFQLSLTRILAKGFGFKPGSNDDEAVIFGGCYFAATGETRDRQAFVKGVIDKLIDEQDSMEWTRETLIEDRRYYWLEKLTWVLNTACLSAIAAILIRRFYS